MHAILAEQRYGAMVVEMKGNTVVVDLGPKRMSLDVADARDVRDWRGTLKRIVQKAVGLMHARFATNPEKLLASATRIYGDRMSTLWGDFLPVPEAQLHEVDERPLERGAQANTIC